MSEEHQKPNGKLFSISQHEFKQFRDDVLEWREEFTKSFVKICEMHDAVKDIAENTRSLSKLENLDRIEKVLLTAAIGKEKEVRKFALGVFILLGLVIFILLLKNGQTDFKLSSSGVAVTQHDNR